MDEHSHALNDLYHGGEKHTRDGGFPLPGFEPQWATVWLHDPRPGIPRHPNLFVYDFRFDIMALIEQIEGCRAALCALEADHDREGKLILEEPDGTFPLEVWAYEANRADMIKRCNTFQEIGMLLTDASLDVSNHIDLMRKFVSVEEFEDYCLSRLGGLLPWFVGSVGPDHELAVLVTDKDHAHLIQKVAAWARSIGRPSAAFFYDETGMLRVSDQENSVLE